MTTYSAPRGPAPKPQRRRRNKPVSYGEAEPVVAGQADGQPPLGFDAPKLVLDLWSALGQSVEGQFYSAADLARARWEMWFTSSLMSAGVVPTARQWATVQHALSELLISPAAKRRAGIELRPQAANEDADAAVSMIGRYRQSLKPV
jgi:hypothetical protein